MNTRILVILTCLLAAACQKTSEGPANAGAPADVDPLLAPGAATWKTKAPPVYRAKFETTKGDFVVEVHREWAPHGADRFYNLVRNGFYDKNRFFRVLPDFVVQWGLTGDPSVNLAWQRASIPDDPVKKKNEPGTITFATAGPNTRTTQLFINLGDNSGSLDGRGFAPFGRVVEGMDTVTSINAEYGQTPDQNEIVTRGNVYLSKYYPRLDEIRKAYILE